MKNRTYQEIQRAFWQGYYKRVAKKTMKLNHAKYYRWRTSHDRNKGKSTQENIIAIRNRLEQFPNTRTRRHPSQMGKTSEK